MERTACDFRADVGFEADFRSGLMKAWGAVHAISIEERHGGHLEVLAHADQFLGQRSAFEKAECGASVKFDVHQLPFKKSLATDQHGFARIKVKIIFLVSTTGFL